MIQLSNVNKTYTSNHTQVKALTSVSLKFGFDGMTCILGKSGSGKSTLLNMIGGLDHFDSGNILFHNSDLGIFSNSQLDEYRNSHVGFVFQEFHMIDHLSVGENVKIALDIQGIAEHKARLLTEDALHMVGLEGYFDRSVTAISGGQKQRVAIARAIVKNPEILLADEPTGNLDTETGKRIMDLLKEISKHKIVIVVTHDRDYAEEYGDRIIEIENGIVISDRIPKPIEDGAPSLKETPLEKECSLTRKNIISFHLLVRFVKNFLSIKKGRQLFHIVIFSLSLMLINLGLIYHFYEFDTATIRIFQDAGLTDIPILAYDETSGQSEYHSFDFSDIESIASEYPGIQIGRMVSSHLGSTLPFEPVFSPFLVVPNRDSDTLGFSNILIIDSHFQMNLLMGTRPTQEGEIAITDFMADMILKYNAIPGILDRSSLVGIPLSSGQKEVVVSGIVDTDYESRYDETLDYSALYKNGFVSNRNIFYAAIYTNDATFQAVFHQTGSLQLKEGNQTKYVNIGQSGSVYSYPLIGSFPSASNEIVICLSFLDAYFEELIIPGDITGDADAIHQLIGRTITLNLEAYRLGDTSFQVVGIIDDFNRGNNVQLVLNQTMFDRLEYGNTQRGKNLGLLVSLNPIHPEYDQLTSLLNTYSARHYTPYSAELYGMQSSVVKMVPIIESAGAVLSIIAFLMISSFVTFTIVVKKKEIGILRAMGVSKFGIVKIYLVQNLVLLTISYVLSIVATIVSVHAQNRDITSAWNLSVSILYVDYRVFLIGFLIVILLGTFASGIPTFKSSQLQPVDAIRG